MIRYLKQPSQTGYERVSFCSPYTRMTRRLSEVLYRVTKYMNAEDALMAREEKPKKREKQEDTRQDQGCKKARTGDQRDKRRTGPREEGS